MKPQGSIRKHDMLNLAQQNAVLKELDNGMSSRSLAMTFNVSKSTINNIRNRRDQIVTMCESNVSKDRKRKINERKYFQVNTKVYEFFTACRGKNIPISGPILQAAALKIAEGLNVTGFRASNGWLESFRKSYQIMHKNITGESADVNVKVIENWLQLLPDICKGYAPENIFNADETALFFKQIPSKTLHHKAEEAKGGKLRKERVSVLLCSSSVGEKLPLLVIGHSAYPRAFKRNKISLDKLPVEWTYNKKAWMTTNIFTDWLKRVNKKMIKQKRKILLFIDNAPSHSVVSLSNVTLKFLPPNTSSIIQPMDQGVIKALKSKYRNFLMNKLISSTENYQTASDFTKSINIFDVVCWLATSWDAIDVTTIQKCFKKSGFTLPCDNGEKFSENEDDDSENLPQHGLFCNLVTPYEFYTFDSNVDVHGEFPDTVEGILDSVIHIPEPPEVSENEEEEDIADPYIPRFCDAISSLNTLIRYAAINSDKKVLSSLVSLKCSFEKAECENKKVKQTLITDFML